MNLKYRITLIGFLQQIKKHHALTEDDALYQQLINIGVKNFCAFTSKSRLLEAFKIAERLIFIYGALSGYRLIKACGNGNLIAFQPGKFSAYLKEFMASFRSFK
ncbi:MAG: hypothetical protein ACO2ZM_03515 [Francisellaceae bacterium]